MSGTDKVISPAGQPTHTVAPIIGNDTVRLIENQKELNLIKQVTFSNAKLRDTKRKAEVQTISFENFKRHKLGEVGNRGTFDTERKYDIETAGLLTGLTDILVTQPYYKTTLTVNKAPMFQGHSENTSVDCWVT